MTGIGFLFSIFPPEGISPKYFSTIVFTLSCQNHLRLQEMHLRVNRISCESPYIFNCCIGKILHLSDDCPAVWMPFRVEVFQDQALVESIGSIINTFAFFILDDILLIDQVLFLSPVFSRYPILSDSIHSAISSAFFGTLRNNLSGPGLYCH